MQSLFAKALSRAIYEHTDLSASRQETLGWLVLLIMQQGTICLWRLAAYVMTLATTESVQRRFYRFFQYVRLDGALMAPIVIDLLGLRGKPWVLAINRTNWDFGKTTINILMIAVVWNGMGIPLIWMLLPSAGNSNTATRVDLLDRLHALFPDLTIACLMGDREFIGDDWMAKLKSRAIPFILRLRENQYVVREGCATWTIAEIASGLQVGEKMVIKHLCRLGGQGTSPSVRLVILRLKTGELLALACSEKPKRALAAYRERWKIETMFANLKTKGFNMEDTRLTNPDKLSTLIAVLALAVALAIKTGIAAIKANPIPIKNHGRRAGSFFALGLARLRKIFIAAPEDQVCPFLQQLLSPKIHANLLIALAR